MAAAVELYWIPLGAGGWFVKRNGRVYEAIVAARARRPRRDLYHAALIVELDGVRHALEVAPAWGPGSGGSGVVATGAVGARALGRWKAFRYELRCTPGGVIPDLDEAVGGAQRLSADPRTACRVLDLTVTVPRPTWGRDELEAGDMWNSNSVVAWLLASCGVETGALQPPEGGRAPGWQAGLTVASRATPGSPPRSPRGRA